LLQKGDIYSFALEDIEIGKKYYDQVINNNEKSNEYYAIASYSLELIDEKNAPSLKKSLAQNSNPIVLENSQKAFHFYGNFPNPFNPSTTFRFYVPWVCSIKIEVYNYIGQKIYSISKEYLPMGENKIIWDGNNNSGESIASGLYFARLVVISKEVQQKRYVKFSKLIILK